MTSTTTQTEPTASSEARKEALVGRLEKNPRDSEAYRGLERMYARERDYASLSNLQEGWARQTEDAQAAADAYEQAANAVLRAGPYRRRACNLLERALTRAPGRIDTLRRLAELLGRVEDATRAKHTMQRLLMGLSRGSDARYEAELEYRLADAYLRLGHPGRAMTHLRKAIDLRPDHRDAIVSARSIYEEVGNHRANALLYELEVRATPDPKRQVELLLALSELLETMLDDLDGAVLALRRAIRRMPNTPELMEHMAELLMRRNRDGDRERAAELYYEAGLARSTHQREALLRLALQADPSHTAAKTKLASIGGGDATAASEAARSRTPSRTTGEAGKPGQASAPCKSDAHAAETGTGHSDADSVASQRPETLDAWLHTEALDPLAQDMGSLTPLRPLIPSEAPPRPTRSSGVVTLPPPVQVGSQPSASPGSSPAAEATMTSQRGANDHPSPTTDPADATPPAHAADEAPPAHPQATQAQQAAPSETQPPESVSRAAFADDHSEDERPSNPEPDAAAEASPREGHSSFMPPPPPPPGTAEPPDTTASTPPSRPPFTTPVGEPAEIVERLPEDFAREELEVNLGPHTPSNCYVGLSDRMLDGGVFISTYQTLPPDAPVEVLITLPGGLTTRVHGRVRFVYDPFAFGTEGEPGMAVKLERIDDEGLALLEHFIRERAPLFYED